MAILATPWDVAARWRPLSVEENVLAATWIEDVSGILRFRVPSLDADIAAGTIPQTVVTGVVARSVLRAMKNPDGKVQESIDDYSYRRADAVADGALYVSADDLALVASAVTAVPAAYTVHLWGTS